MFNKKSIVLNGVEDISCKGILSIEKNGDNVTGDLRLYNFNSEPNGIISLGIYSDDKVYKAGLTRIGDMFFSFKSELNKIPLNFSCAVVNFDGGEPKPLLYGNSNGYENFDKIFDAVIDKLKNVSSSQKVEEILDEYNINFSDEEQEEIDKEIERNMTDLDTRLMCENEVKDCENCEYKKFYLSNTCVSQKNIQSHEIDEQEKEDEMEISFYEDMKEHIEKLFENNPHEDYLENLLPNSKFVRVELEENNYYVLGLIYEENEIKYICYGVPGIYQKNPPKQLTGNPIWFPIDEDKEEGFGYWLSYQDAQTGENVKAIVV